MPTSDPHNITPIVSIMQKLDPRRILDIGCGFGKYGVLLREYLDIWQERIDRSTWQVHIEGIEAFPAYRNPIHDYAYNAVHFDEAQKVLPRLGQFDVVLIADVIEHLEHDDAKALIRACFEHSPAVVISTPREFYPQQDLCGNEYEKHRCTWTRADFPEGIHVEVVRVMSCDIFVASKQAFPANHFRPIEPSDFVYLWSRKKLGTAGLPVSAGLRWLNRTLG